MKRRRIIIITGAPATGKTTTAAIIAKESDLEKSVHIHTDDFYHYLSKGAIPPHLPESDNQNLVVIEAFLAAAKRLTHYRLNVCSRYRFKCISNFTHYRFKCRLTLLKIPVFDKM